MSTKPQPRIMDLGSRVELVPMDQNFHDISIGLYERSNGDKVSFLLHTYSTKPGALNRVAQVARSMELLGGMEGEDGSPYLVRFPCGRGHRLASRRIFLEAVKLVDTPDAGKPLEIFDKKSEQTIEVISEGEGNYFLRTRAGGIEYQPRVAIAALGLVKLGELKAVDNAEDRVHFECGMSHDGAIALLLRRALNVRAAIREIEEKGTRGILAAPSSQSV